MDFLNFITKLETLIGILLIIWTTAAFRYDYLLVNFKRRQGGLEKFSAWQYWTYHNSRLFSGSGEFLKFALHKNISIVENDAPKTKLTINRINRLGFLKTALLGFFCLLTIVALIGKLIQ